MGKRKKAISGASKPVPKLGFYGGLQLSLILAGCCLLAAVTVDSLLSGKSFHRHGVLTALDASARTLEVQTKPTGRPVTFVWNESTEFLEGEKRVSPEALRRGVKVVVHYRGGFATPHTASLVKWATPAEKAVG